MRATPTNHRRGTGRLVPPQQGVRIVTDVSQDLEVEIEAEIQILIQRILREFPMIAVLQNLPAYTEVWESVQWQVQRAHRVPADCAEDLRICLRRFMRDLLDIERGVRREGYQLHEDTLVYDARLQQVHKCSRAISYADVHHRKDKENMHDSLRAIYEEVPDKSVFLECIEPYKDEWKKRYKKAWFDKLLAAVSA
jgi:hypothetical protein